MTVSRAEGKDLAALVLKWNNLIQPYLFRDKDLPEMSIEEAWEYLNSPGAREDGIRRAEALPLEANSSILEIGPGPGILSISLGQRCAKLTAVEAEVAMAEVLKERALAAGLENIEVQQSLWEDFETKESFDYVISSLSLLFEDILAGLKKMDRLAKKRVYIYWFDSENRMERQKRLANEIFGRKEEIAEFPKLEHLEAILQALGIDYKKEKLPEMKFDGEWEDLESLSLAIKERYKLEPEDPRLMEYIRRLYKIEADQAKYIDQSEFALIYWDKL
ncbi:MAG: class I SAM-dependent methyltransferase [Eubacteriales bacterium]|nr:class I SAM-dependent methyltransferase [Eubacteriales bacterium]